MHKGIVRVAIFAVGALAGSAATWQYFKTKYEKIAKEEIESVKETFSKAMKKDDPKEEDEEKQEQIKQIARDKEEYKKILQTTNYASYHENPTKEATKPVIKEIEVISPDDFAEMEGYDVMSLFYFEPDDLVTDDAYNIVEDVEGMIGVEALDTFGEYEDDSVFVRNHRMNTDFEILRDHRPFADVTNRNK